MIVVVNAPANVGAAVRVESQSENVKNPFKKGLFVLLPRPFSVVQSFEISDGMKLR